MILINITVFLLISAIFIYVYKPKSKSDAWLFSIIIPIVVYLFASALNRFFYYPNVETSYLFAATLGESLVSIIVSFITLFVYLKKKYIASEQFKFPKWLIATIIILFALGLFSEWGNYNRNRTINESEAKVSNSQSEEQIDEKQLEDVKELSSETEDARKVLPELVEFLKQGLPVTREGMSWNDVEISNNALIYYITIDEKVMNFSEVTKDIESSRLEFFKLLNAKNQQLVNKLILAEYDFSVEFKASKSGQTKWITLLASELKDAKEQ